MSPASFASLLILAAIWGGSFLFMRIAVPVLGPVLLVEGRVGLAALFLLVVAVFFRKRLNLRAHWKHYVVIGFFNSALPFLMFSFAAKTLSASILSILNATSPIWGAVIGTLWKRQSLSLKAMLGMALGIAGVATLVGLDTSGMQAGAALAICCALGAAFSYALATTYTLSATRVDPFATAHGSMWAATFLVAPIVPFFPSQGLIGMPVLLSILALGIVCSGIAYLLYFRLVADVGPTSALTVTFLIPVFGILWGHLVLGEQLTWHMGIGAAIVVAGTALVTGFSPAALIRKKSAPEVVFRDAHDVCSSIVDDIKLGKS